MITDKIQVQPLSQTKKSLRSRLNKNLFLVSTFNKLWDENNEFRDFARQVYHYLDHMKVDKYLRLDRYEGKKLEWIVVTAAAFIAEGIHAADYYFSDDYCSIHHVSVEPEILEEMRTAKYGPLIITEKDEQKPIFP